MLVTYRYVKKKSPHSLRLNNTFIIVEFPWVGDPAVASPDPLSQGLAGCGHGAGRAEARRQRDPPPRGPGFRSSWLVGPKALLTHDLGCLVGPPHPPLCWPLSVGLRGGGGHFRAQVQRWWRPLCPDSMGQNSVTCLMVGLWGTKECRPRRKKTGTPRNNSPASALGRWSWNRAGWLA